MPISFGKVTVLGGPSVSSCPDYYPTFDYLHVGEIGDATDDLIEILSHDVARPERQVILKTKVRHELANLPSPAYELARLTAIFWDRSSFQAAALTRANSATSPAFMAACRG